MTPPVVPERAPQCPRCGYDLRGAVAAWRDACPMSGTCTECGLTFVWAEILLPQKFEPPWCVEFTKPPQRFGRACLGTILRSARPWRFWSALNMSMPVRSARLGAYLAMLLLLPLLLSWIVMQTGAALRVRLLVQRQAIMQVRQTQPQITRLRRMLADTTLDTVWRIRLQQQLVMFQRFSAANWLVRHSYPAAIAEAVLVPWRSKSSGAVNTWVGPQPYTPPRDLHVLAMGETGRARVLLNMTTRVLTMTGMLAATWNAVTMPLAFVLLPWSRRRAKVRWAHLLRVGCYGLAVVPVLVAVTFLLVAIGYAVSGLQPASLAAAHLLGRYGIVLVTVVWWAVAIRCYLYIPRGWVIAPALAVLLLLLLAVGVLLVVSNVPS